MKNQEARSIMKLLKIKSTTIDKKPIILDAYINPNKELFLKTEYGWRRGLISYDKKGIVYMRRDNKDWGFYPILNYKETWKAISNDKFAIALRKGSEREREVYKHLLRLKLDVDHIELLNDSGWNGRKKSIGDIKISKNNKIIGIDVISAYKRYRGDGRFFYCIANQEQKLGCN